MPTYPVLPSLSRAPSFETVRKIDDGTLSDPKESGYVSTRPRFTRLRRSWSVGWKNLVAEDVRALDLFETQTVKGMAGAFYLPNLLPNGSFELPALQDGEIVQGWTVEGSALWSVAQSTLCTDGLAGVSILQNGGPFPGSSSFSAGITSEWAIPVAVGDVYQVTASVNWFNNFNGDGGSDSALVQYAGDVTYADDTQKRVTLSLVPPAQSVFQVVTGTVTIPSGSAPAVSLVSSFLATLSTTRGNAVSSYANRAACYLDAVSLALVSAAQPYGRMPGNSPLSSPVRFTKGLEIKDAKPTGDAQKRYDVSCTVTEL